LLLRVDVRGGSYPLRIDPFVQQGGILLGGEEKGPGAFGWSVALSSDGNTALVGGFNDTETVGAAWVFTRSEGKWSQQGPKIKGGGEIGIGRFGWSVALSSDGNTALIGGETDNTVGAAWVFTRSEGKWSQQGSKLTGGKEEIGEGRFGYSVALSSDGNTALIGSERDNEFVGAAWLFTRSEGKWSQQGPKLTGGKEEVGKGSFGSGVGLSSDGNTALIGGSFDNSSVGAVWVFTRSGGSWTQQGPKLTGGKEEGGSAGFGKSVAVSSDGNTALIGGPSDSSGGPFGGSGGAAWVFTRSEGKWSQQGSKLTGGTPKPFEGWDFGDSVALSSNGSIALIGGFLYPSEKGGAAWVFTRSEGKWSQQGPRITGGGAQTAGTFGYSVALSSEGNTALVSDIDNNSDAGAVWVFVEQTSTSLTTLLSGEGKEGETLTVLEGSKVKDKATLSGKNASKATGKVTYKVYSDKECKTLVTTAGEVTVSGENVPASNEETLTAGASYYWQAHYTGDPYNSQATSTCTEISNIIAKTSLSTKLSGEGKEGEVLTIEAGSKAKDIATLSGTNVSTATGKVAYAVYSDSKCEHLVTGAGEVELETSAKVPGSTEQELEGGNTYYWRDHYTGDALHQESTSTCSEILTVQATKYAALGDSYSSGQGTNNYYGNVTNNPEGEAGEIQVENIEKEGYSAVGNTNQCHRSPKAYPVFVAEALFGAGAGNEVFAQQPRKFIFRACNGAIMENLWPGKGQWHEWVENVNGVAGKNEWFEAPVSGPTFPAYGPEQDSWLELPGGIPYELHRGTVNPNRGIGLVTFSIGGNDAGFATVAENCPMTNNSSLNSNQEYSLTRCEEALIEWEMGRPGVWYQVAANKAAKEGKIVAPFSPLNHGLPSIRTGLPTMLTDVHQTAPNATIGVILYPQILDINGPNRIIIGGAEEGIWLGEAPVYLHGKVVFYLGKRQAELLARFERKLDEIIKTEAEQWAAEKGARVVVINAEKALEGNELGDQETWKGVASWVNPIVWRPATVKEGVINGLPIPSFESFHPNCNGHLAIAKTVLTALQTAGIGRGVPSPDPGGWTCP
jgi:hypothetical protein